MAKLNAAHADQVKHFQSQLDQINKENSDTHQSLIKTQAERDKKHREEIDDRNK
jgi:septal ring factor EnvC (AmiA/AmiB activator)